MDLKTKRTKQFRRDIWQAFEEIMLKAEGKRLVKTGLNVYVLTITSFGFFDEKIAILQEWRSIKNFFFFGDSINMFEVCNCKKEVIK